jgi:hypothetical protein
MGESPVGCEIRRRANHTTIGAANLQDNVGVRSDTRDGPRRLEPACSPTSVPVSAIGGRFQRLRTATASRGSSSR